MLGTPAGTKVNICRHLVKPTEVWTDRTQKKKTPLVLIHLPIVQLSDTGEWPNPTFSASFYASGKNKLEQAQDGEQCRGLTASTNVLLSLNHYLTGLSNLGNVLNISLIFVSQCSGIKYVIFNFYILAFYWPYTYFLQPTKQANIRMQHSCSLHYNFLCRLYTEETLL